VTVFPRDAEFLREMKITNIKSLAMAVSNIPVRELIPRWMNALRKREVMISNQGYLTLLSKTTEKKLDLWKYTSNNIALPLSEMFQRGELDSPIEGVETEEGVDPVGKIVAGHIEDIYTQSQLEQYGKRASIRRIQKSIANVSKRMEGQIAQINGVNQVVQSLQKQTKSGQRQSDFLNQIKSQVNQIQRQVTQVQKMVQKKPSRPLVRKSMKKKSIKYKKRAR
jgi:methyl-accepting chemotaxis protein